MTVLQIKNYVWSLVDDPSGTYFTTIELDRYINQCIRETQKKLIAAGNNWYVKIDESQSTVINQGNYSLPSDFLKINRIELVQNPGVNETRYSLQSIPLSNKDAIAFDSDTAAFYLLKSTLWLAPFPSTVRTIRVYYTYLVAETTSDSDVPDVPPEYHEYIAMKVAEKCFIKDGREATLVMQNIMEVEKSLEADAIERNQDHASRVVVVSDDHGVY